MAAQLEAALAAGNFNRVKNLMRTTTFEDINKVYNNASGKKTTLNRVRSKGPAYASIGRFLEQYGALSYEDSASMTIRDLAKYQRIKRLAKNEDDDQASFASNLGQPGNFENGSPLAVAVPPNVEEDDGASLSSNNAQPGDFETMSPLLSPLPRPEGNAASVGSNVAQAGNFENASPLVPPYVEEESNSASLYNPESPKAGNYLVTPPPSPQAKSQAKAKPSVMKTLSVRTTVHIPIKLATEIVPGKRYYMSRFFRTHINIPGIHFMQQTRGGPLVSPISGLSLPVYKAGTGFKVIDTRYPAVPEKDRTYDVYTDIASGGRTTKRKTRSRKNKKI
jgi:hypothetical protein